MAYDKPGWAKRIEALERVRDNMKANVLDYQYLHNTRHYTGGDDPLTPANIGAANQVHKHSYTDLTDLQNMLDGYDPGANPNFPGGIGGITSLDLTKLAAALLPLIKPYISNTAKKVGEYGDWKGSYRPEAHPYVMENCTPGKLMIVRGFTNGYDSFRRRSGVIAYTSIFPSVGGIWTCEGHWYPIGDAMDNRKTKDPNKSNYLTARANWLTRTDYRYLGPCIRDGNYISSDSEGDTIYPFAWGQNAWLIYDSTVRVCCSSISGDDYPYMEFYEI